MPRVLLIGANPDAVDYADPALPKGLDAEKIEAGIDVALDGIRARGWEVDHCLIQPDDPPKAVAWVVQDRLASDRYDCVIIGGGIRLPPKSLPIFEAIINAVHAGAPQAKIAFNTHPEDSADAAARWIA